MEDINKIVEAVGKNIPDWQHYESHQFKNSLIDEGEYVKTEDVWSALNELAEKIKLYYESNKKLSNTEQTTNTSDAVEFLMWVRKNGIKESVTNDLWLCFEDKESEDIIKRLSTKELYELFLKTK